MATQNSELNVRVTGRDELTPKLKAIESGIIRFVGSISAALAGVKIGAAPILAAASFERELANVAKTTDFTASALRNGTGELEKLGAALLDISLRVDVTATDLAKIAAAAGQQGLGRFGVAGVVAFTDSVARMSSVLDVTAEQAANDVGKIVNIFRIPLNDIERAISTFNEVSNKSTASGQELLDVVKRIGDAAGSLKLGESVAIAATALDFGTSPEVAGTAFARIFSAATEKADEFAKLLSSVPDQFGNRMTISATEWITKLKTDGVGAFKDFLATLRKLDQQSQQAAIVKLVGGGRIGALLNKFVQDSTNSVLERNLAASAEGQQGISALKEQSTVLNTLDAQAKILRNSFVKLGIDSAQALLGPLTQYAAQLSSALQQDNVKSFVGAAVSAVGDLVGALVSAVKFVADLNVNWENFIRVLKVFVALKVAQVFGDLVSRISVFGVSLKSISANAAAAASATKELGAATAAADTGKASFAARVLGYSEAEKAVRANIAAVKELQAAEAAAAQTRAAAATANKAASVATAAAGSATTGTAVFGAQVSRQREALRQAEQAAAQAQAQQQATLAARIAAADAESAQRRLQIENDYQTRRKAIVATGTETGLKALRAERVTLLAEEQASHERSLRGIQNYYARRAATQNAALELEVQKERAALMQRFAVFDGLVAEQATRQASATAATQAATAAGSAAAASATRLAQATAAAGQATAAVFSLGAALRTVGSILLTVGRLAASAFFWVTIVYSIADALGLVEKAAPVLTKITDWLGFTSKARRDAAVAADAERKAYDQTTAAIEKQTEAYRKNIDVKTGKQNLGNVQALLTTAVTSENPLKQQEGITGIAAILEGAQTLATDAGQRITQQTQDAIDKQVKIIDDAREKLKLKQEEFQIAVQFNRSGQSGLDRINATIGKEISDLQKTLDDATKKVNTFNTTLANAGGDSQAASQGFKDVAGAVASMFTPQSAKAIEEQLIPMAALREQAAKLTKEYQDLQQQSATGNTASKDQLVAKESEIRNTNAAIEASLTALRKFVAEQSKIKGLSPEVLNSYQSLFAFVELPTKQLQALVDATKQVNQADLTGKNAPKAAPATSGDTKFESSKEESQARKLARARLLLRRAEIQAENALVDEQSKQRLAADQKVFDQGLTDIAAFYKRREQIQQDALQNDINDKVRELAAIEFELRGARDEVERVRFQTDKVRVQGQVKVLQEQKKAITADNAEAQRKATQDFLDKVLQEQNKLKVDQIIPAGAPDIFKGTLDEMLASYRIFLAQLRSEGKGKLADSLEISFNVEAFKKSIQPAQDSVDLLFGELDRFQRRIAIARGNNALTTVQADQQASQAIREQLPLLQQQLAIMEDQLATLAKSGLAGSDAYAKQAAAVDGLRLRLQELGDTTDKIAKGVNESLTNSLTTALDNLSKYGSSLKDVVNGFLLEVANNVKQLFLRDIAERITQGIGSIGAGGFGGFIQGALTGGQGGTSRGSSPTNPLFVNDISNPTLPQSTEVGGINTFFTDLGSKIGDFFTNAFNGIKSFLGFAPAAAEAASAVSGVAGAAGSTAKAATETANTAALATSTTALAAFSTALTGAAGPAAISLAGIELAAAPVSATLGALSFATDFAITALGTFAAALEVAAVKSVVAHSGGIVGASRLVSRRVNPFSFIGAPRYHVGGIAGKAPGEVPAILQKGEAVLTKNQQSLVAAAMDSGSGGATNIRNVLVMDPNLIPDSLATSQSEKVLMTFITRNRASIRQALG